MAGRWDAWPGDRARLPLSVDYCPPTVTTCWEAKEPRASAALRLLPPETRSSEPRPIAAPPMVSTCWSAWLKRPAARLELNPPETWLCAPRPKACPPSVVVDWVARLPKPRALLLFSPPKVVAWAPRPKAVPPTVVVSCSAVLLRPLARLRLSPPKVSTRPPLRAMPPIVVAAWPAKLFLAAAVVTFPPPRVIEMPPVSSPCAAAGWDRLAAPASSRAATGRIMARIGVVLFLWLPGTCSAPRVVHRQARPYETTPTHAVNQSIMTAAFNTQVQLCFLLELHAMRPRLLMRCVLCRQH